MGRYAEAVEHYEIALSLNQPALHAKGYTNLGAAYMLGGDVQRANQALAKALRLESDYADAHFHLARLYKSQGLDARAAAAMQHYEQLAQAAKENSEHD